MTGYVDQLRSMKYNVSKWMKEGVVRAFGVCYGMRDDGHKTESEIKDFLSKGNFFGEEESYYKKELKKYEQKLELYEQMDDGDWEYLLKNEMKTERAEYDKRLAKFMTEKAGMLSSISKVKAMYRKAVEEKHSDLVTNSLKFALEQLNSTLDFDYRDDYQPKLSSIFEMTVDQFKNSRTTYAKEQVIYYQEKVEKEEAEAKKEDSLGKYEELVNFVDNFEGGE